MTNDHRLRLSTVELTLIAALPVIGHAEAVAADAAQKPLSAQVQIRRTQFGVPHIQGETLEAVAFGFGYCQAEDHLQDIMRGILGTRGELALWFGPGKDNANIEADRFSRQFRIRARALETYHKLDPDYRAACEGFAAGLNDYVDRHRDRVPEWVPKVTPHDVAAYGVAGVMRFAFNRGDLLKDFFKAQGIPTAMLSAAPDETETGSNMWAFAPAAANRGGPF